MCAAQSTGPGPGAQARATLPLQVWPHWQVAQAASPQLPEWEVAGTANLSKTGPGLHVQHHDFKLARGLALWQAPQVGVGDSESESPTIESHRVSASVTVQQAPRGPESEKARFSGTSGQVTESGQVRSGQVYYSAGV